MYNVYICYTLQMYFLTDSILKSTNHEAMYILQGYKLKGPFKIALQLSCSLHKYLH